MLNLACNALLFLFCLQPFKVNASLISHTYKHFSVENGLPGATVYCATQDADGFMWFGTDAGVSKFDGRDFINYGINDGVSDSDVLKICQDSKGRLWFLTLKGLLSYYYKGKIYNPDNDSSLPKEAAFNGLMTMHEDCYGNLWFGGLGSQVIFISESLGSRLINLDEDKQLRGISGWVFLYEPDSINMWIIGMEGKFIINKKTLDYKSEPHRYPTDSITLFSHIDQFKGLLLNNNKAFFINGNNIDYNVKILPFKSGALNFRAEVDGKLNLWVYENRECYFFEYRDGIYKEPMMFLPGQDVNRVFVDNENNKWFCTSGNGVYLMAENQEWIHNFAEPKGKMVVMCTYKGHDNSIWFGTSDGVLGHSKNSVISTFNLSEKLGLRFRILSLTGSTTNDIYCATDMGAVKVKIENNTVHVERILSNAGLGYSMKFIAHDRMGKLYCADNGGISFIYTIDGKEVCSSVLTTIPHKRTYSLFFDHQNKLWYENFDELICWDYLNVISFKAHRKLFGNKITSINQLADSTILVATNGSGLRFIKNGKITDSLNTSNGLSSDICRRIFVEGESVYVATNNGFTRFRWVHNRITQIERFSVIDGLLSDDINDIVTDSANIYLATSIGLCIMDKNIKLKMSLPPIVRITEVYHRNEKILNFDELRFKYDDASLTVRFIGVTFVNANKVSYQFSINDGNGWEDLKTNTIQFSELQPGSYTLLIRAKKYNSGWSVPAKLSFIVAEPFYKETWFLLFIAGIVFLIMYLLVKFINTRKYEDELRKLRALRELEHERNRIAAEMHDDFGADLTLISIQAQILKNQKSEHENNLTRIDRIAEVSSRLIDKMGEIIWALNTSNDTLWNLISYIHKYSKDYLNTNQIKCVVTLPPSCPNLVLNSAYRRNAFLIIKEAIHNIVKHSGASNVTLSFEIDDEGFKIVVADDGNGISGDIKNGTGLANMHKRAESNGATLSVLTENGTKLRYTDKKIKVR